VSGRKKPPRSVTGMPPFSASSPVTSSPGFTAKSAQKATPFHSPAERCWLAGENWVRSMLTWITKILRFGAAVALRRADREGAKSAHTLGGIRNVLIVGADGVGVRIANYLDQHPEEGRAVCGFLDDRRSLGNGIIGRTSELARLARSGFVDEVILAAPHDREMALRILEAAQRLRLDVRLAPDLFGCTPARKTEHVGGVPLISLHEEPLPVTSLLLKRALDVVGGGRL
jgi:hypothetical protein